MTTEETFLTGDRGDALARLERLEHWLDSAFVLPGTSTRFGLDAIVGLVPGVGDIAANVVGSYLVLEAWRLGAPLTLIIRMLSNLTIDATVGAVPLAGDVFDLFWRANRRNLRLLREHLNAQ